MKPLRLIARAALTFTLALTARGAAEDAALPDELVPYAAVGTALAQNIRLRELNWSDAQLDAFLAGIRAARAGRQYTIDGTARQLLAEVQRLASTRSSDGGGTHFDRLRHFLESARQDYLLQQSDSGLLYRVKGGLGPRPRPQDRVVLRISASGPDGNPLPVLSSNETKAEVADLLPGLAEGVQLMALGGEAFFVLSPHHSFGKNPG
ncbi:MAG TPA: hypothetical protein VEQ65_07925, partial [Opitutus sp.]|nr:hypothetical protein [Opitutus sp.]